MSLEASLAENVARLPMDEIDQYEAFALKRRVAIAELIGLQYAMQFDSSATRIRSGRFLWRRTARGRVSIFST
jgi:hypothetical protein